MYKVINKKSEVFAELGSFQAAFAYIKRLAVLGIDTTGLTVKAPR